MDKKTDLASSIYFSDKAFSLTSQGRSRLLPERKQAVKIEIVNQNLEDAIREVRTNIRENPQWRLNVQAVTDQYNPKRVQKLNMINQSIQERPGINSLPQGRKEPQIMATESGKRPNFEKLKYTERMKKQYEERIKMVKEKRMQLEIISLERQMRAKLDRKVKENMMLKDKAKLIEDIQEKREEKMRLLDRQHLTHRQEQSLLHQSNVAKVDMLRRNKKKISKRQLSESLSKSEESKIQLKFRDFLTDQKKQERKEMLVTRYRMLRSASQGVMRHQRIQSVKQLRTAQFNLRVASDVVHQ